MTLLQVLMALAMTTYALGAYSSGGAMLPFVAALGSLRLRRSPASVRLRGLDPAAMAYAGALFWPAGAVACLGGWRVALMASAALLLVWWSFRVDARVTARETRLTRTLLFVIPWSSVRLASPPRAEVDGWGDWADPEALWLRCDGRARDVELGWSTARSGDRAARIASEFADAVRAIASRG